MFLLQINIPEIGSRNAIWRYFSKLNVDALVEITRWRRERENSKDEPSAFSEIRKRFGHHRKSLKNRVKKLYTRSNSDPIEVIQENVAGDKHDASSPASSSEGKPAPSVAMDGGQFRKRERHLFGSMLKKSRTSFCLDDVTPKRRIIVALGNGFKKRTYTEKVCQHHFLITIFTERPTQLRFLFRRANAIANSTIKLNIRVFYVTTRAFCNVSVCILYVVSESQRIKFS